MCGTRTTLRCAVVAWLGATTPQTTSLMRSRPTTAPRSPIPTYPALPLIPTGPKPFACVSDGTSAVARDHGGDPAVPKVVALFLPLTRLPTQLSHLHEH